MHLIYIICDLNIDENSDLSALVGVLLQVFISIALILGDGLYNFLKILFFTIKSIRGRMKDKNITSCKCDPQTINC